MDEKEFRDTYSPRIKEVTLETLPAFVNELMNQEHDYGSICVALGLAAAATAWACDKHENGGITGFQAGAVFWEFVRAWDPSMIGECGARVVNYDELLFPQYKTKFTSISQSTFDTLKKEAEKQLADNDMAHPEVIAHWQSIVAGQVPFDLSIRSN